MPRQLKRACRGTPEPEMEAPAGKHIKANKTETPVKPLGETKTSDSPKKNQATKDSRNEPGCYWLMKSEPESRLEKGIDVKFGIEDLKAQPKQTACWDGVRNYQIVKEAYPDHTQFEKDSPHYDPSSKKDNPKWSMVDVQFVRMTKRFIPLTELKGHYHTHKAIGGPLQNMALFTRQRLSVQPVTQGEFDFILSLEDKKPN
ncbi:thymocyte nuclear protein 1 isoform X2 [Gracilinanus agilis]|uniref:thymocyte nuclear protein 1 isoform X2 n=1 Tax=Gracilinanus agilis TaxID=191870 RepID=UPI001CFDD13F|nr:thymocyte nuclear protein 1 isoform X2 [Gracilinanus agilis]